MKTILVVDDFATVRLYHVSLLKRLGHVAEVAGNGEEALELLRQHRPDMVLLDMYMPRMGGAEFLRRVRAMPGCDNLPVFVVSSAENGEREEELRCAGASGFLKKPVPPAVMVDVLSRFIG